MELVLCDVIHRCILMFRNQALSVTTRCSRSIDKWPERARIMSRRAGIVQMRRSTDELNCSFIVFSSV